MEGRVVRKAGREQSDLNIAFAPGPANRSLKLQQCVKIAQLREALCAAGLLSIAR